MCAQSQDITVAISPGELLDKLSILEIKSTRITDAAKQKNVTHEYALLSQTVEDNLPKSATLDALYAQLKEVNCALWDIEDNIRECERQSDFTQSFIDLARAVYITNDKRAALKKDINVYLGSRLVEEKSYNAY